MSNIKRVCISGEMPFNTIDNEEINSFLGQLNSPCMGLRITWHSGTSKPNKHGGQTAFYRFVVKGDEAINIGWIEKFFQAVVNFNGSLDRWAIFDIENGENIKVTCPKPNEKLCTL